MDCKECEKLENSQVCKCKYFECRGFKPKQHPLDMLIEEIEDKSLDSITIEDELIKLRYESIKWAFENPTITNVNTCLKNRSHEDWIPNDIR